MRGCSKSHSCSFRHRRRRGRAPGVVTGFPPQGGTRRKNAETPVTGRMPVPPVRPRSPTADRVRHGVPRGDQPAIDRRSTVQAWHGHPGHEVCSGAFTAPYGEINSPLPVQRYGQGCASPRISSLDNLKISCQLPIRHGPAELALLPLTRGGVVVHKISAKEFAGGFARAEKRRRFPQSSGQRLSWRGVRVRCRGSQRQFLIDAIEP